MAQPELRVAHGVADRTGMELGSWETDEMKGEFARTPFLLRGFQSSTIGGEWPKTTHGTPKNDSKPSCKDFYAKATPTLFSNILR